MKLRAGSFGLIALLIVMGIVLLLVAKSWQKIAPAALPLGATHGETEAAEEVREGELPNIQQTQQATDAHTDAVDAALEQID